MYSSLSSKEQYVCSFPKWRIWQPRLEHHGIALSPKCSAKMNSSSCVEGWTNYFFLVSDLPNRYPNSLADWMWQAFSEEVVNCPKPQNPKMKHINQSRHFAKTVHCLFQGIRTNLSNYTLCHFLVHYFMCISYSLRTHPSSSVNISVWFGGPSLLI